MSIYAPYHLGSVSEYRAKSSDIITSLGTTAYTSGDSMNLTTACIRLDSVSVAPNGIVELTQIMIHERRTAGTKQKADIRLWFFTADYTGVAQNAVMVFPTDETTIVGYADVVTANYIDTSANHAFALVKLSTTPVTMQCAVGTRALYMVVQAKAAPTYDATATLQIDLQWT